MVQRIPSLQEPPSASAKSFLRVTVLRSTLNGSASFAIVIRWKENICTFCVD